MCSRRSVGSRLTGARSRTWRKTDPEFPGVSEFLPDELAHVINLGRGTAAFRARRAYTWRENLPGFIEGVAPRGDRRTPCGVLADVLQHTTARVGRSGGGQVLPEACELSLAG